MSEPAAAPRHQPSILLIVSLCLNLAMIGLIGIAYMRTGMRHFEPHEDKVTLSAQSLMRLAPNEQPKIQAIIDAHRKQIHQLRQKSIQARAEAFRLLDAHEFNADAFAKSLVAVQNADTALETATMAVTAESVAALTPAERKIVAGQVRKPDRAELRRFFRRH